MKFTKNFKEISKKDVGIAGGKGASLGEMLNARIPVPPGFVVLASAFDRFLEETDLFQDIQARLDEVNYKDTNSVDRESNEIREMIADTKFPVDLGKEITSEFKKLKAQYVAVRSSATAEDSKTASWAGELETYLNTTEKELLVNVKKCWSSLFTPRAIFYRHEKYPHLTPAPLLGKERGKASLPLAKGEKQRGYISVAVVIQKMIQSEVSGIAFTVHPVTEDKNQMILEAGLGLGEAIVSGQITPDSYVIDKRNWSIVDINIAEQTMMITKKGVKTSQIKLSKNKGNKQKLTGRQIVELAKLCGQIEKHYGFPCDIEWAREKGKFYITQSRPITTL
ncbi:MAG TPA: PEP/pyruvate-binding domain-containing protein [Patescibacteria group bacterium]|nr:PEP/pyruvate-binding domain-containing protein [Patescibacteria group bacterium]